MELATEERGDDTGLSSTVEFPRTLSNFTSRKVDIIDLYVGFGVREIEIFAD